MNRKLKDIEVPSYAQIIDEWYKAMDTNGISVQPRASTILGTILAKYNIQPKKHAEVDLYEQYMNTKGGEFHAFWSSLSNDEKAYVESKRQEARDKFYNSRNVVDSQKQLLKG
tara:strand:- start:28 stop:366 length:339 start_codon:yes stop_codon:yes gene_type:complete